MATKKYTAEEILSMAVGSTPVDLAADADGDGTITAADSRLANRVSSSGITYNTEDINAAGKLASNSSFALSDENSALAQKYMDEYNNSQFDYDVYSDPVYLAAAENYKKQGQQAAKNVQARAAALTGGYGNSYGAAAAQQEYNEALSNINDIIPDLEANAYSKYEDEQNKRLTQADYYQGLADSYYNRGLTEQETAKTELQEANALKWEQALTAAEYGDYSLLEALGVDTSSQKFQDNIDRAAEWASYGDYSLLKKLGIDTSALESFDSGTEGTGTTVKTTDTEKTADTEKTKDEENGEDDEKLSEADMIKSFSEFSSEYAGTLGYKVLSGTDTRKVLANGHNTPTRVIELDKKTGEIHVYAYSASASGNKGKEINLEA